MCGIAGFITRREFGHTSAAVRSMISQLNHRGPDSSAAVCTAVGDWVVHLGHTRLAIIDLSQAGSQPMSNPSRSALLTYNGEVYNFKELRNLLPDAREPFESETDTEVILRAYDRWGVRSFARLRGMFAFGLLDTKIQKLFLVRDQLGIKPLYFCKCDGALIFGSELRTILASGHVSRELDPEAVGSYLLHGSVTAPNTIVRDVRAIPPGHVLEVDLGGPDLAVRQYCFSELYSPVPHDPIRDPQEAVAHIHHLLRESAAEHLVSDVPLGLFLSGGIDSTALLALTSALGTRPMRTFCVSMPDEVSDESKLARAAAVKYGAIHSEISLTERRILHLLPGALGAMDQPTMDGVNSYIISEAVKASGITVALSGLGGDELFAGYPSFKRINIAKAFRMIPSAMRQSGVKLANLCSIKLPRFSKIWDLMASDCSPSAVYRVSRQLFSLREAQTLLGRQWEHEFLGEVSDFLDPVNQISYYELTGYMSDTLLRDTDFMSMAHSLEVRVPFLDARLVKYVLNLPGGWKMSGAPKPLLQAAMRGLLPPWASNRKKIGFGLPFKRWLRSSLRPQIENAFADEKSLRRLGIEPEQVRRIWNQFEAGITSWSRPWALYVLQTWCQLNDIG